MLKGLILLFSLSDGGVKKEAQRGDRRPEYCYTEPLILSENPPHLFWGKKKSTREEKKKKGLKKLAANLRA